MSLFNLAIPIVLRHEGGFVDNAADPGGVTNYGVSLRWLKAQGLITELEHSTETDDPVVAVQRMTRDDATAFYQKYWWDAYHYGDILPQAVAAKIFDTAVNLGAPRAHRFAQQVVGVTADGVLGPATLNLLNTKPSLDIIAGLQNTQAAFYRGLVERNPKLQQFLAGWLNRAFDRN